ncbi:hypothetical protein QMK33_04415 [Hymenobacter sp. H14-R3]|uniref:hypothetical protein n=1 Tax=Hymenobacter sp. H14-R3 TaxID=3046308 RepID=UPI0024BA49FB|nr:hypothetical protein [Hymenobacter sp. H14-R3]MDJ0364384.1 hypothetical protein [Hymenobacter sp. H14-R3]
MNRFYAYLAGLLLGAGLLPGLAHPAAAQTTPADTTRLRYGEEVAAPAAAAPRPIARQERGVWKLGLNNFLVGSLAYASSWRAGLHVAYEHQLGSPAWSVLGEVSPAITRRRTGYYTENQTNFALRAQVASRYYYNLERRRRQGLRTAGFSANYVAVAIGASLFGPGGSNREAPFLPLAGGVTSGSSGTAPVDVAVLYGVQRRFGRRGFMDASLGLGNFFTSGFQTGVVGSLRLGVVLGSPPSYPAPPVPATAEASLHPRVYLGVQAGRIGYRLQYPAQSPYPESRKEVIGGETRETNYGGPYRGYDYYEEFAFPAPTFYAGYYLLPRLAVQAGATYWASTALNYTTFTSPGGRLAVGNGRYRATGLALPVVARYSLTPVFLRRWQFEALGGLTLVRSTAEYREYAIEQHQVTDQQTAGFRRTSWGLHATLGLAANYSFGRRRQVQATAELTAAKDLRTGLQITSINDLTPSGSLGLRYRFGYR